MRILHVVDRLRPEHGGTSGVAVRLAAAQKVSGADVTVACHREKRVTQDIQTWRNEIWQFNDVKVMQCALRPRHISSLLRQFDVVHIHGMWMPFLACVCWQAQRLTIPTILAPHGMLDTWSLAQKRFKKSLALSIVWRHLIDSVSVLHALNSAEHKQLSERFPRVDIRVIPNGIFLDEFSELPPVGSSGEIVSAIASRRYVLFLARLHYMKAPDLLLDAFSKIAARIPDLDLVFAGPDYGMATPLKKDITRLGLSGRVHLPGAVYGREKLALLRDAVCMCQPSRHEGFSVSMLEAMACGVPVITTPSANFPEIETAGAGMIVLERPENLARAIARVVVDEELRGEQALAARRLVELRYTWNVAERSARDAYEHAIRATLR